MKLYYAPGACSLAPHIVVNEMGLACERERVDLATHQTEGGVDFRTINPKNYVPTVVLDDGAILTEVAAVVQYLADRKPGTLAAEAGTMARYRQIEWLNFIASEIHKQMGPLFRADAAAETREHQLALLGRRFDFLGENIRGPFLDGDEFSVADAYLFTTLNWARFLKLDMDAWAPLTAYLERVQDRAAVKQTLAEEGLL